MAEPIVEPVIEQKVEQQLNPVVEKPIVQEPDLITKVTQFKKPENKTVHDNVDIGFDYKELENIKDPIAKEVAMKAYKSMQAGATKKFQEAAEIKKTAEQKLLESNKWTRERVQKELQNPDFLNAAQEVVNIQNPPNSGLTDEQFSVLTNEEKARVKTLENKINILEQDNFRALVSQQDVQLSSRYTDYDSLKINKGFQDLAAMNPIDVREHIYKAVYHDDHVKAAYELGKQEALKLNQDKVNAISAIGGQAHQSSDVVPKNKGENDTAYFVRLAQGRLAQSKK